MHVLVAQSRLTLCNLTDCSPPGFSAHGILQTRILEWIAIPFSRGSSQPRDRTLISFIAGRFFTLWAIGKSRYYQLQTGSSKEYCQRQQQGHLLLPLRRLNPVLLQLLTFNTSWRSSGWMRCSVLQGIWWDRSLDDWIFLGTDFTISIPASPHI